MEAESDYSTLSRLLAATERRASSLELENDALREEINALDPSGSAERRAQTKHAEASALGNEALTSISERVTSSSVTSIKGNRVMSGRSEASVRTGATKAAVLKAKEKTMVSLHAGDLVWLRQKDETQRGTVLGDCSLKTVGVQLDDPNSNEYVPPLRFSDGAFRLCSRFNYRSKVEVSKINKAIRQSNDRDATRRQLNLPLATKRMASEAVQNAELLERLVRCSPDDPSEPIRYGDVVQLQHVNSGFFLAMHKTPAPLNPTCRKVSLKAGSLAAHFKILPKYKVRSIGSLVYSDDEIVFQSVKHEGLYLGASDPTDENLGAPRGAVEHTELRIRGPSALQQRAHCEVNGAMEMRSFTINIYRRIEHHNSLFTSLHWFRLFHPEANAFVQASANPDKGSILDAFGTENDPVGVARRGGVPAHVPYLKSLEANADASNPINLSAKAVWCFEPLDRTTCVEVKWRTMPLRIRHVPSGKYLSVDSSQPTPLTPSGQVASAVGAAADAGTNGGGESDERATFFDAALVDDADPNAEEGAFGSPSSLIFHLMPTDVTGVTLREGTSAIRVEHRSKGAAGGHRILHLVSPKEPKPPMLGPTGGGGVAQSDTEGTEPKEAGYLVVTQKQTGVRLCFTSEFSALHVLKVQPVGANEASKLNKLLSYLPLFKKYSYAYHAGSARSTGWAPVHLCIQVATQCLDLIDDLRKGKPPARKHGTNMTEALKETHALKSAAVSLMFGGEPEPRVQKAAYEMKLLEVLFEAVVAPYNFSQQAMKDGRAFVDLDSINPIAVQKILFVAIQRVVYNNLAAQDYFSHRSSRVWIHPVNRTSISELQSEVAGDQAGDGSFFKGSESTLSAGEMAILNSNQKGASRTGRIVLANRKWELWRNIIVAQGEDSLGALVTLGQLLKSSAKIVKKLVNNELMQRFQSLLKQCGPEVRLINLFASICFVEGRPSRANQEMCVRKLWMNPVDRYDFGVTFHEVDVPFDDLPVLGTMYKPDGQPSPWPRERAPMVAPKAYLGRERDNRYKQVCVAWTGANKWETGCGHLWYSPEAMGVGPVVESRSVEGVEKRVQLVPLEQLMWVIEPKRLSQPCTGKPWVPFSKKKKKMRARNGRTDSRKLSGGPGSGSFDVEGKEAEAREKRFENQLQLATYVIAELELLTQMCKGRSNNCIAWLEKNFSFGILMNLATNPHLPYKLVATAMDFMQALYVDRFPQLTNSGAPSLPEKLWVYHENSSGPRRSTTPVIQKVDLRHDAAFPVFFLSPLSSASGNPDPVMSHPDHFKFYLLRSHCNAMIKSFGKAGRIVHNFQSLNDLGMASIRGQQNLLKFGFQSTHAKLIELCVPNGALLDGRSDLCENHKVFDPPTARYRDVGSLTQVVTKLKKEVIDTFFDISDLRANFRLAQLLYNFKEKSEAWTKEGGGKSFTAQEYIMQSTPAAVDALYADFEAMFPGGSGDGAKLDIAVLTEKKDLDQALIDCMMYDDDTLMSSALRLLESNYGQRRQLRTALSEVTLLEHVRIPVYGDVHALRADLSELVYLARTSTVWGVKSRVAGPFGDNQFSTIMHSIDKVLVFMYTPYEEIRALVGPRGEDSSYRGEFSETDLQGNSYTSTNLWSLDVADKWGPQLRNRSRLIDKRNQDILRSCNLQAIMLEAVVMDPEIAWKGSICTDREKAESERRLTMVKRALLVCCTVFAANNRKNQDIMFERLSILEDLATPRQLLDTTEAETNAGLDLRDQSKRIARVPSKKSVESEWPTTITELAQSLILTVLKGNSTLCESIPATLASLFSHIANRESDVSTAPALDLLFILCKPESIPRLDFQTQVCSNLTAFERGQGLENLFRSLSECLEASAAKATRVPRHILNNNAEDGIKFSRAPPVNLRDMDDTDYDVENPERLVRLLTVVCEGGNEAAAAQLKQSCGISIDAVCIAIVNHLEHSLTRTVSEGTTGDWNSLDMDDSTSQEPDLSPQAVLYIMSEPNSVGRSLLGLLVEVVFLLPLNHEQIMSGHLWRFLQFCAVPMMEAIAKIPQMGEVTLGVCTEIVDLLEHIFIFVVRLGLFRAVNESPDRERVMANVAEDLSIILEKREKTPEFLRNAFMEECESLRVTELNKEQFFGLILKLTRAEQEKDHPVEGTLEKRSSMRRLSTEALSKKLSILSPERKDELNHAFDEADLDGSGDINMYEFVALFSKVNPQSGSVQHKVLHNHGHRLALRTVECADRILAIRAGRGPQLAAPIFSRQEQYGIRRKGGNKSQKRKKLFVRPTTTDSSDSSDLVSSTRKKAMSSLPLYDKFHRFQSAVQNNPRILGALQKRRFTMVTILEKGTPGPPAEYGRSLSIVSHDEPVGWGLTKRISTRMSTLGGLTGQRKPLASIPAQRKASVSKRPKRAAVAIIEEENEDEEEEGEPAKEEKPLTENDEAALKIQLFFRAKSSRVEPEPVVPVSPKTKSNFSNFSSGPSSSVDEEELADHMEEARIAKLENGNPMSGAVALSWEDITRRLVQYVTDHFWSSGYDRATCTLIFETWFAHLIKARTWALDEDGRKLPIADMPKASSIKLCTPHDLNEFELTSFNWKQSELNRMGVTQLLAMVVSSLSRELDEGALPDTAIELFNELLNGGNEHVQNTLYSHLVLVDTEGKLVEHMAKRLEKAFEGLVEAHRNGRLGSDDDEKAADIADDCDHVITTTRFLQLLCEGHHAQFQNYLRCQPMYGGDVDLVKAVCNMLVFLCESTFVVSKFTYVELDLVNQLLNTLIDATLGPCAGNQELIAKSDVIAALNLIIHAVNTRDVILGKKNPRYMGLRGLSCLLLAACLEGREDQITHQYLERRLEPQMLQDYRAELEENIWVVLQESKTEKRLPRPDEVERVKITQQFLVAVSTVLTELDKRNSKKPVDGETPPGTLAAAAGLTAVENMAAATKQLKGAKKQTLVGLVEIAWRGKVERTCFPLPFEIKYLAPETKKNFLDEVDLSTSEKRMKALVKKTDRFVREMELIYHEAEQSEVYRVVHKHLPMVKLANYGLVFALNLNLLLSPASLRTPVLALFEDIDGTNPLSSNERLSLFFTTVLGALVTIGYGLIIANLAVTEVPLLIQELDEEIRESTEEAIALINERLDVAIATNRGIGDVGDDSKITRVAATTLKTNGKKRPLLADEGGPPVKRDRRAWLPLTFGLLVTVLFSMLHAFNFDPNYGLYVAVILIASVPLTFSCLRDYVGDRPANQRERAYAIVYDCLVRRSFARNHLVLTLICFLGYFVNVEYFTLELLDVVIISPVIADIIKSVTTPGKALGLVFYLFCCTVLIFASFGMSHFHDALQAPTYDYETEEESRKRCESTLSCFYLIFYHGLNEAGNLKQSLLSPNPGNPAYFPRIMYDSMFFVWVGIVLMNIITGLMVDTFSSIREEKQTREEILANDCFVCGTLRNTYEDFALSAAAPGFDAHLTEDHNLWTYVYYVAYLKKKDPTEDSGIESYVREQLDSYSLEWIPSRTSFVLEAEGKTGGEAANASGEGAKGGPVGGATNVPGLENNGEVMKKIDFIISELNAHKES